MEDDYWQLTNQSQNRLGSMFQIKSESLWPLILSVTISAVMGFAFGIWWVLS